MRFFWTPKGLKSGAKTDMKTVKAHQSTMAALSGAKPTKKSKSNLVEKIAAKANYYKPPF